MSVITQQWDIVSGPIIVCKFLFLASYLKCFISKNNSFTAETKLFDTFRNCLLRIKLTIHENIKWGPPIKQVLLTSNTRRIRSAFRVHGSVSALNAAYLRDPEAVVNEKSF